MSGVDITDLILNDHHRQRQMFALLDNVDPSDTERLALVWGDVADFLEVHAAAEEVVFYPELLKHADPDREETLDAITDHNDIRNGVSEAAKEEDEALADFRKHSSLELRHELAVEFEAAKTAPVAPTLPREDKDPEEYVEAHTDD